MRKLIIAAIAAACAFPARAEEKPRVVISGVSLTYDEKQQWYLFEGTDVRAMFLGVGDSKVLAVTDRLNPETGEREDFDPGYGWKPTTKREPTPVDNTPRLTALAKLLDLQHQMEKLQLEYTELWVQTHSKGTVGNGYQDLGGYWYKDGFFHYPYKTEDGWKYHKRSAASSSGVYYRSLGTSGIAYAGTYRLVNSDLTARVEAIEKSLAFDVPTDKPVTPAFIADRAAEKEKNKDARRRRHLYQHINNQLDYQFASPEVKDAEIAEMFVKPKDEALAAVIEEYKAAGWDVEFEPGTALAADGTAKEGYGHWRFQPAEAQ